MAADVISKRTDFLKQARLYFDMDTKETFSVTDYEYERCKKECKINVSLDLLIPCAFALNGHRNWIWKSDEDYSDML